MQRHDNQPTFYFQADASSLSGFFEKPFPRSVDPQSAVSLGAAGGFASARVPGFNLDDLVSCKLAYATVSGGQESDGTPFSTKISAVIEGLNIVGIVKAERIELQLLVEVTPGDPDRKISLAGTNFYGLTVNKYEVEPGLNAQLDPSQSAARGRPSLTLKKFRQVGMEQSKCLVGRGNEQGTDWGWLKKRYGWMDSEQHVREAPYALCSFIDGVTAGPTASRGHILDIPEIGRIFLGEILVSADSIQVSMIRAELGCKAHGTVGVATGGSGGHMVPPLQS